MSERSEHWGRVNWALIFRVIAKAGFLFLVLNIVFAWLNPLDELGQLSLYNWLLPGRLRLPYGENSEESFSLSLNSLPAMVSSHVIEQPKAEDEFRVVLLGDSGTWGWLLKNDDTLAGQINDMDLVLADGRRVVVYNLGYPIMALTKDLLILEEVLNLPGSDGIDLVIWPVTLESFPRNKQLVPPLNQHNPERIRGLIDLYGLNLDPDDPQLVDPTFVEKSIVGQRRALADLLRLQTLGFSWAATGVDQAIPVEITLRKTDFDVDLSWNDFTEEIDLTHGELAFDVLAAGMESAGSVPVLLVNEPIFISDGENSHLRYNAWYPRWAYDAYRALIGQKATVAGWRYLDLWDRIEPEEFTDSPVHLTPAGTRQMAEIISEEIKTIVEDN